MEKGRCYVIKRNYDKYSALIKMRLNKINWHSDNH